MTDPAPNFLYSIPNGDLRVETTSSNETVWLSLKILAELIGIFVVERNGTQVAQMGQHDVIMAPLTSRVMGITEMLKFLEASHGPQDSQAILDFPRENLGIEWKIFAQINYCLNWLRALIKVTKAPEGWSAA